MRAVGAPGRLPVQAGLVASVLVLTGCSSAAEEGGGTPSGAGTPTVVGTTTPVEEPRPSSAAMTDLERYAEQVVDETNAVRQGEDLAALERSDCALRAALDRAQALVGEQGLEHAPLDGVIRDCAPASTAGENLSRASVPPQEVVSAWMDSPGHRSNLLEPGFTEIGVGCVDDDGAVLCSQVFLGP